MGNGGEEPKKFSGNPWAKVYYQSFLLRKSMENVNLPPRPKPNIHTLERRVNKKRPY